MTRLETERDSVIWNNYVPVHLPKRPMTNEGYPKRAALTTARTWSTWFLLFFLQSLCSVSLMWSNLHHAIWNK